MGYLKYAKTKDTPVRAGRNKKLGTIPNVALVPIETCINNKFCRALCYAVRMYKFRQSIRKLWRRNTDLAKTNPAEFFLRVKYAINALEDHLKENPWFRIHTSGDFFSKEYLEGWADVARTFPDVVFWAPTKAFPFLPTKRAQLPSNLVLTVSVFPPVEKGGRALDVPPRIFGEYPISFMGSPDDYSANKRATALIAAEAYVCPGSCKTCKMCWTGTRNVLFPAH